MITGAIAVVFVIAGIVCAENGEWWSLAVCAVVAVAAVFIGSASRECDRAYSNFVGHWRDDERIYEKHRRVRRK